MISRKLLVAALGLTLAAGTVADASAKLAAPTATKTVATKTVATKTIPAKIGTTKTGATKVVTTKVINGKHVRMITGKHHRFLVSHRAVKHVKIVRKASGKRLLVSHVAKRITRKHA